MSQSPSHVAGTLDLQSWYRSAESVGANPESMLEEAFKDALARFESENSRDSSKTFLPTAPSSLSDIQESVTHSMKSYQSQRKKSKVSEVLVRLAHGVQFYGAIFDVLAQHHPEYVALAWGMMKFLVVVSLVEL